MGLLYNLARMTTATVGTGTITLGSAVSGFLTFAGSGVSNGEVVSYGISDGANSEVGTGTYTTAGTTLTRTVTKSTNSNTAISLSGTAQVFICARAEDIPALPVSVANGGTAYTGGALSTYTATLTPNTGTITQGGSASSLQIGKLVIVNIAVTVTATSGAPVSFTIAMPAAPVRDIALIGEENGNTGIALRLALAAGSTTSQTIRDTAATLRAPTVSDKYVFTGIYEAS